jgi:putative radical SAM enzyme (TIGR03279 family)
VGLRAGDELLAINGHSLRDVIDVRFYGAEERLVLEVARAGQTLVLEAARRYDEPLGIDFARPLFDPVRCCNNNCSFCFVAQLAPGLRRSLYVRDDDYRLSFLHGSYVTLTNLEEADWARIGEQHLSPLYVSVHATEPRLRRRILRRRTAPDVMAQLRRLAALGVGVHTQIVVTPGLNDGAHLDRAVDDLAGLYPAVRSVSVVPVGLTRFHRGGCRVQTDGEVRAVLDQITARQERLRRRLGAGFAYLSDEWYLRLGEEVPPARAYDGLDLVENGVGLVRRFFEAGCPIPHAGRLTMVTGTLFAPLLRRATAHLAGVEVLAVSNRFFGETVTVAGLLTAQDVVEQLGGRVAGGVVALPPPMFGGPDGQSLDGWLPQEVAEALECEVVVGRSC